MNLKSLYAINLGALALVLMIGIYFGFLEGPILSYLNSPFPTIESSVKPGQIIHLRVRRCNSDSVTRNYMVSHQLIGGPKPILLKTEPTSILPGCYESVSPINQIPSDLTVEDMPSGKYYILGTGEVQGTFRSFIVPWRSQQFEIVR